MTALFANHRETNLASTVALIEQALAQLGHAPAAARLASPAAPAIHAWQLVVGSARTVVEIVARSAYHHLRISAVVLTLDGAVDRPALFAHLLAVNAGLCGTAFAVDGDRVLLVSERSALDLDQSEVLDLIDRVTRCADDHDDALVARYGGRLGG